MKVVAVVLAVFAIVAGVVCGSKGSAPKPAAVANFPAVACSTLADTEVTQLLKDMPSLRAALRAASWRPTAPKEGESPVSALAVLVEGMNVPGVDDSLKKAGSDWGSARKALYKIFAASAALSVQGVGPEGIAQLKRDTSQAGKDLYLRFQAMQGACATVPPGNMALVRNYQQQLAVLDSLGR